MGNYSSNYDEEEKLNYFCNLEKYCYEVNKITPKEDKKLKYEEELKLFKEWGDFEEKRKKFQKENKNFKTKLILGKLKRFNMEDLEENSLGTVIEEQNNYKIVSQIKSGGFTHSLCYFQFKELYNTTWLSDQVKLCHFSIFAFFFFCYFSVLLFLLID